MRNRLSVPAVLTAGVFLLGACGGAGESEDEAIPEEDPAFTLPDVTGLEPHEAEAALEDDGVRVSVRLSTMAHEEGTLVVWGTSPEAGSEVEEGELVYLCADEADADVSDVSCPPDADDGFDERSGQPLSDEATNEHNDVEGAVFYDYPGEWLEGSTGERHHDIVLEPGEGEVRGWAVAPNAESWPVTAAYDVEEILAGSADVEDPAEAAAPLDCAEGWEETRNVWLRDLNPSELGDEDYQDGPTAGPTCLSENGGSVSKPDYRLVHYVCQSANITARTLIGDTEGETRAWTPEYTTGDERQCFSFDGHEVRAYATESRPAAQ